MLFSKPLCSALVNQVGASHWGANPSLQERSREPKVSSLLASHLASDKSEARSTFVSSYLLPSLRV